MLRKTISGMMLTLLLLGIATLALNIRPVKAEISEPPVTGWSKTYGGTSDDGAPSIVQTNDGGYALAGMTLSFGAGSYDFWFFKTDSAGNMQWNKTYGGSGIEWANGLVQTADGGYALAGCTESFGAGNRDAWLVKTDASGNVQWNKTFGGTGEENLETLVQTGDGGYTLAGHTDSFGVGNWDGWLVKTDVSGNVQWNKTYGGADLEIFRRIVQTGDGGYALAGQTRSSGAGGDDCWLVKTDAAGNAQWNKTYGGTNDDRFNDLVQTVDEGYAIAGYTYSFGAGGLDCWLVKTDAVGNAQWNKTYGGTSSDGAYDLVQTIDGGYVLAAGTASYGAGGSDGWLIKTDSSGNVQWNKTYGGTGDDGAEALVQTVDGGYALAGGTTSFGAGGYDFWLVKVIENNPPDIGVPSQNPARDNVLPYQNVKVSVNVTDAESGVKNATLYYSPTNGTSWEPPVPMTLNVTTSLYEAAIPGQPIGTWVRFKIVAYDIAGNNATRDGTALDFIYVVIPEFPTTAILPLFMILTLLAAIFYRRKHQTLQNHT